MERTSRTACGRSTQIMPQVVSLRAVQELYVYTGSTPEPKIMMHSATFFDEPVVIWRTANSFHTKGHCGQEGGYCWDGENETVLRKVRPLPFPWGPTCREQFYAC
jgi:hypothetical protein